MEYLEDARSFGVTVASGRELGGPPKHPKLSRCAKWDVRRLRHICPVLKRRTFVEGGANAKLMPEVSANRRPLLSVMTERFQ